MKYEDSLCQFVNTYDIKGLVELVLTAAISEEIQKHLVSCDKHPTKDVKDQIFKKFCPGGKSMEDREKARKLAERLKTLGFHA